MPKLNLRNPAAAGAFARGDLANALIASTPGGIEAQEAAGQAMLVNSNTLLPIRINFPPVTREQITAFTGIVFGEDYDGIFVKVTLPPGWKLKPTDHSMWSDLLDENDCERAGVFYKAAFYDRNAYISFNHRYVVDRDQQGKIKTVFVFDRKTKQRFFTVGTCEDEEYTKYNRLVDEALQWLRDHYPNCDDPFAYWKE